MITLFSIFISSSFADSIIGDGYEAVLISNGNFTMGCTSEDDKECFDNELPPHKVTVSKDFYLMKSEVTQSLYKKIMGANPSSGKVCGENCPVENVTWLDAVRFANALSKKEGLEKCYKISGDKVTWPKGTKCTGWRLPTEAEWEYSAKANENFPYSGGENIDEISWHYQGTSDDHFMCYQNDIGYDLCDMSESTCPVCSLQENAFGLCDMSGNVWEWVWDRFDTYTAESSKDPLGPDNGSIRVYRGGSKTNDVRCHKPTYRMWSFPSLSANNLGFRLAQTKK
jgi:formylglycine-generating enzyme